jgi:tetratricopeptide (TPR) repeat protein
LGTAVPLAAVLLLSIQVDDTALLTRLKALDDAAASTIVAAETSATRASLDRLLELVDASVHSDRQHPEQRRVQYDREALTLGLRVSTLLADVTGDRVYRRRFAARKQRLDGTELLNDRRYRDALKPLNAALAEAQSVGDKWLQAIARVNLAYGHLELGHGHEALTQSERAAEIVSSLDDKARALTLYNLGSVHLHLKNFERSVEYSQQAVAVSRKAGVRLWEGNSLLNLGAAHQQLGDIDAARIAFEQALGVLEKTRDRLGIGRALYNLGVVALEQERYEPAASYLERALPVIREVDIRHSHEIELDAKRYRNPFEAAALQMLIDIYSRTGQQDLLAGHMAALRRIRSVPPAAHSHQVPR